MIIIEGIQVDLVGSIDSLLSEWAIFTVEFEYDSKVIICHTFDWTVRRGIINLINKILSPKVESIDLRQSFINSKYITVEVNSIYKNSPSTILKNKYELIKSNITYYPYGYNFLLLANNSEKPYAYLLHNELIENIDTSAHARIEKLKRNVGRATKPVYQYDASTGLFMKEHNSAKEASEYSSVCKSNINMCCNGHIKSAGGYIWSYEKMDIIELPTDARRKEKIILTKEERSKAIAEKQQEFIRKNQN